MSRRGCDLRRHRCTIAAIVVVVISILLSRSHGAVWALRCVGHRHAIPPPLRSWKMATSSGSTEASTPLPSDDGARFGRFWIPAASIFLRTPHSVALVNLRPIVPGHVLVISRRVVPHLRDLSATEYDDLWRTVRTVQAALAQRFVAATDCNVAVQDGPGAGQSVPHVHVHILPRTAGDWVRNDDLYDALERWAPRDDDRTTKAATTQLHVPADQDRRDRTAAEMAAEAEEYRRILQRQQ